MTDYFDPKTKTKLSEQEYNKLSDDDKKRCKPWRDGKDTKKPGRQDYQWYLVSPQILKDVASLPFHDFAGRPIPLGGVEISEGGGTKSFIKAGASMGVFTINELLTYGDSNDATSAINIAAKSTYSFVRHMNSGRTNYESSDLMLYFMAMDQVYASIARAKRAYNMAVTYSYENKFIPSGIALADYVDLDSIVSDLANFRAGINLRIQKVSAMCVPKVFNIHKRHYYTMANVFADSDSMRGQFYLFHPEGYLQYQPVTSSTGGSLVRIDIGASGSGNNPCTASDLLNDIDNLLDQILYDEDMNIMSGDVLKSFGSSGLYTIDEIPENEPLHIGFNEDVLQQIENAVVAYPWLAKTSYQLEYSITQDADNGFLKTTQFAPPTTPNVIVDDVVINSHKGDDVKPEQVIEWTRCTCNRNTYATDLVLSFRMTSAIVPANANTQAFFITDRFSNVLAGGATNYVEEVLILSEIAQFDWHPILYATGTTDGAVATTGQLYVVGDLKKFTTIHSSTLKTLNDSAVMGALNSLGLIAQAKSVKAN